jgi:threonine dehydrogenase-like Zn-dependent dehydrogenase
MIIAAPVITAAMAKPFLRAHDRHRHDHPWWFRRILHLQSQTGYKIPDSLPLELAAMGEPSASCLHGIDLSRIKAGSTVLVIGAGTIGLMMLQLAKQSGAARVVVIEPIVENMLPPMRSARRSASTQGSRSC